LKLPSRRAQEGRWKNPRRAPAKHITPPGRVVLFSHAENKMALIKRMKRIRPNTNQCFCFIRFICFIRATKTKTEDRGVNRDPPHSVF